MAVTQQSSIAHISTDPLRNFKFQVNINNPSISGLVQLGFMSCAGLNITTEVIPYRQGGYNTTALPYSAQILTTSGWKANKDIQVGDRVIDPRGDDSKVIGIYPAGVKDVYKVTMQDGSECVACYGHLWEVQVRDTNNRKKTEVVSTIRMKNLVEKKGYQILMPKMEPFGYDALEKLPIHPYVMGILLAEGSFSDETLTFGNGDEEIVERVRELLPDGLFLGTQPSNRVKYRISSGNWSSGPRNRPHRNPYITALRDLGLWGTHSDTKFIPEIYLRASIEDRIELLRGLMDGDGSIKTDGNIRYASVSQRLIEDLRELICSLGGRARIVVERDRIYTHKGERRPAKDAYWINGVCGLQINPFFLTRKAERFVYSAKSDSYGRRVVSVEHVGQEDVQCIEVSARSHLFVTDGVIPSHNTQKLPGQSDMAPITLSRGLAVGDNSIWQWQQQLFTVLQGTGTGGPGNNFRCNMDILVLDHPVTEGSAPVKAAFRVYNAWPSAVAFSDLDAGANAIIIQQMTLAHEGFDFKIAASVGTSSVSFN